MTHEEMEDNIRAAAMLRVPDFDKEAPASQKIEALEDHLLDTARWRNVLEAYRLMLENEYEEIDDAWRNVVGHEIYFNGKPKSQDDIDEAKRQVDPSLFGRRRKVRKLLRQVGNQVRRLEKDDGAVSRAYTMLTGS